MIWLKNIFGRSENRNKNCNINIDSSKMVVNNHPTVEIHDRRKEKNMAIKESIIEQKEYVLPDLNLLHDEVSKEIIPFIDAIKEAKELSIPIGKCNHDNLIENISDMPNLLIGGTVMSGKSTYINFILVSMLLTKKPFELKFIIYDAKGVEYSQYGGIPHLLTPIISDEKKLSIVLKKAVDEIERRYELLKQSCQKNLKEYNNKLSDSLKRIPNLVIIIDDYSNLILTDEIDSYVEYISKNGWNVNVYLIVVVNHPSSKVISTVSKANFPTRISFKTASKKDSMIILDEQGAEKLKEVGSALYKSRYSTQKMIKIPIVSEEDIKRIIDYSVLQQNTKYGETLLMDKENIVERKSIIEETLYNEMVEFVIQQQKASTSLLQRRFRLGYNRAARAIDLLEENGIIGPQNGVNPREVLVKLENCDKY